MLAADQETSTWVHLPVPEGEKDESADSGPAQQHMIQPDDYTLFTELSRPMPDYALEHVFAQHGHIEWVSTCSPSVASTGIVAQPSPLLATALSGIGHGCSSQEAGPAC